MKRKNLLCPFLHIFHIIFNYESFLRALSSSFSLPSTTEVLHSSYVSFTFDGYFSTKTHTYTIFYFFDDALYRQTKQADVKKDIFIFLLLLLLLIFINLTLFCANYKYIQMLYTNTCTPELNLYKCSLFFVVVVFNLFLHLIWKHDMSISVPICR